MAFPLLILMLLLVQNLVLTSQIPMAVQKSDYGEPFVLAQQGLRLDFFYTGYLHLAPY